MVPKCFKCILLILSLPPLLSQERAHHPLPGPFELEEGDYNVSWIVYLAQNYPEIISLVRSPVRKPV